jgi:hypothetical protein
MNENNKRPALIPPHGGYRNLKSYQTAEIIYDATTPTHPYQGGEQGEVDRFIDKRSRTHDQMVQAARSGKQLML